VISACETTVGDKDAERGFAGLAFQAGVKSVLASIWKTQGEGTLLLMAEFYHQLQKEDDQGNPHIKAEALRLAQVAMLKGQVRFEGNQIVLSDGTKIEIELPENNRISGDNLSHPYFWSGFTIVGSPW
jgi:CHAT domain-containing protein